MNLLLFKHKSRSGLGLGLALAILHMLFFAFELFSGKFDKKFKHVPSNFTIGGAINDTHVSWNEIFSFVPLGMKSCTELFRGLDKSRPFGEKFIHKSTYYRKKLREEYLKYVDRDQNVWRHPEQAKVLHFLGLQTHVRTICETGFNAGHSTYAWLITNPNVTVYTFDLGNNPYSLPLARILQRHFGDRFVVTWGNSIVTLPAFHREHPEVICDVIFIDGGRTYDIVASDLRNFISMGNSNSVIVFNGYPPKNADTGIGKAWEIAKRQGEITEIFHCDYQPDKDHGFSVGRVEPKLRSSPDTNTDVSQGDVS